MEREPVSLSWLNAFWITFPIHASAWIFSANQEYDLIAWGLLSGGAFEASGLLLVASPEMWPAFLIMRDTLRRWTARRWSQARRLIGRRRNRTISLGASANVTTSGTARAMVTRGIDRAASLEEQVAQLIGHDQEMQRRVGGLENRLDDLPRQWMADIRTVDEKLRAELTGRIQDVRDQNLNLRRTGVVFLLTGVVILTISNVAAVI